jgi:hypothetical protein
MIKRIDTLKVNDAIMKHNSARGANTMEFPIGKFAGGAKTIVKTIDSDGILNLGRPY